MFKTLKFRARELRDLFELADEAAGASGLLGAERIRSTYEYDSINHLWTAEVEVWFYDEDVHG